MPLIVTQMFRASSTGASLMLSLRKPMVVPAPLSELSLLEFDWLLLATLEEAGFPVEDGDSQDTVQAKKTKQTNPTRKPNLFIP
jgi:hypothetical protein